MAEGGMDWSGDHLSDIPEGLRPFMDVSACALTASRREEIGMRLNPRRTDMSSQRLLKDWRGLAERLGFGNLEIENFGIDNRPTATILGRWMCSPNAKIGFLLETFCAMERFDILNDEGLMSRIEEDIRRHLRREEERVNHIDPYQENQVSGSDDPEVDEYENITINETPGNPEYFDAFVCYASADSEFVQHMISKLEGPHHGLKLCVPNRDLCGGVAKYTVMAKLIKDRCQKMIIVLSPDFKDSKECDFQTKFAHSLTPGAKEKKLIPVVYKPCQIPDILNHICLLDYTRCDVVDWFWNRLANSLKKDPMMFRQTNQPGPRPGVRPSITEPIGTPRTTARQPLVRPSQTAPVQLPAGGRRWITPAGGVAAAAAATAATAENDQMEMNADHFSIESGSQNQRSNRIRTGEPRDANSYL